jgi:hypothetical protein
MTENIWDRLPNEAERPWAAFVLFRDAGVGRTIADVATAVHRGNRSCVNEWAKKHRWWERVRAYDRHLDQVAQRAAAKARRDMVARHAGLANGALGALQAPVAEFVRRMQRPEFQAELATMQTRELIALITKSASAIKDLVGVERTSRGVPAEILEPIPTDGESTAADVPATPMFRVMTAEEVAKVRADVTAREAKSEMLPAE